MVSTASTTFPERAAPQLGAGTLVVHVERDIFGFRACPLTHASTNAFFALGDGFRERAPSVPPPTAAARPAGAGFAFEYRSTPRARCSRDVGAAGSTMSKMSTAAKAARRPSPKTQKRQTRALPPQERSAFGALLFFARRRNPVRHRRRRSLRSSSHRVRRFVSLFGSSPRVPRR